MYNLFGLFAYPSWQRKLHCGTSLVSLVWVFIKSMGLMFSLFIHLKHVMMWYLYLSKWIFADRCLWMLFVQDDRTKYNQLVSVLHYRNRLTPDDVALLVVSFIYHQSKFFVGVGVINSEYAIMSSVVLFYFVFCFLLF